MVNVRKFMAEFEKVQIERRFYIEENDKLNLQK